MSASCNRLTTATSPYLRAAAHQPVHWNPWDDAPFERAKREDKPILLDIGASWCHWCHVMDTESYDDPKVAELLNEHFVAIKVDRDERPDIDARYQSAVSAITGQGGWPLTAFLTPEGRAFYGGTYFPPTERFNRPSFTIVLHTISDAYQTRRAQIEEQARHLQSTLEGRLTPRHQPPANSFSAEDLENASAYLLRHHDSLNGGFGDAPKFFHAPALEFLLSHTWRTGDVRFQDAVFRTLDAIARGGIHDHLGGGFHRYSTDGSWHIPHFEKMASDNAALLTLYANAYRITKKARYRDVALDIIRFVREEFSCPTNPAFYSSQDADVGYDDDGEYFTWSKDQLAACLQELEYDIVMHWFNVDKQARMPHVPHQNVLYASESLSDAAKLMGISPEEFTAQLSSATKNLRAARSLRTKPAVDSSIYATVNGMMIQAFLDAGMSLDDQRIVNDGLLAFDSVAALLGGEDGSYHHSATGNLNFLDDQTQMGSAALACYEVSGDPTYLERAQLVRDILLNDYYDHGSGGFFDLPIGQRRNDAYLSHLKPRQDSPTMSANASVVTFLLRLHAVTPNDASLGARMASLQWMRADALEHPLFHAGFLQAMAVQIQGIPKIDMSSVLPPTRQSFLQTLGASYIPGRTVTWINSAPASPTHSHATICVGQTCLRPASSPSEFEKQLSELSRQTR